MATYGGGGGGGYATGNGGGMSYGGSSSSSNSHADGGAAPSYGGGGGGYPSYGGGGGGGAAPNGSGAIAPEAVLRRRAPVPTSSYGQYGHTPNNSNGNSNQPSPADQRVMVERLDILFPKVDREFTVQTKSGGVMTLAAYGLIVILCLTECLSWWSQNQALQSNTVVDTSLGKQMRVNLNITFPSLACEDLHVDIIDVAGDSQLNIEDTLKKKMLHINGHHFSRAEIDVETNQHQQQQEEKDLILKQSLPDEYCGPCYGAQTDEELGNCCQTCDQVLVAYTKKKWKTDLLKFTAEQCIREGRDKAEPKRMTKGQGCNLSGYMTVNRVSGNFHIAMGEGIERDGRHIHTYLPEDAPNFNASHVIHQLSFGPEDGTGPLNGATKIVTENTGTTGLFQYFIKVVPTTYVGENSFPDIQEGANSLPSLYPEIEDAKLKGQTIETNRYFSTERYMPLMTELLDESHTKAEAFNTAAVNAGHSGSHDSQHHHHKQNAVLPGVFFIYEIYPFAVEIRRNSVPFTHLIIRLMASIGGVITLAGWVDSCLYERGTYKKGGAGTMR